MHKASGKHLLHAGVIIRSGHTANAEFAVIASFRLTFLVDHHGTNIFKTVGIGNVKRFHSLDKGQIQNLRNLLHRPNGTAFLAF